MAERRDGFWPTVAAGLTTGALAAVAGTKPWAHPPGPTRLPGVDAQLQPGSTAPLAGAVAFVVLAGWGVVLVTRGHVRRLVGAVVVLAALGYLATVIWFPFAGRQPASAPLTGWFWVAAVVALPLVAVGVLALLRMPRWPEMGRRYDAPGAQPDAADGQVQTGEASNLELWKAQDQGHDPTA